MVSSVGLLWHSSAKTNLKLTMSPLPNVPTSWASVVLIIAILPMLPTPSMAQSYKCIVEGKVVYQQTKCNGGEPVNTSGAGKGDPSAPASVRLQQEIDVYNRREAVDKAISQGRILIGMTNQEVLRSWGAPTKINSTISARGSSEQWVYRREKIGNDQYVYVENGIVRSIQTSAEPSQPR